MKRVLKCFGVGLDRFFKHKRLLLVFYLPNLFLALIIAMPIGSLIDRFLGRSSMRESLVAGIDWDFLFEFIHYNYDSLASLGGLVLVVPVAYLVLSLFLSGGALSVCKSDAKYSPVRFWGGGALYFGRILRLALLSLPLLAGLLCVRFLADLGVEIFFSDDPYENVVYWAGWIKVVLGYVGLLLYWIIFDYARIDLVLTDETKVRRSLGRSFKFVFSNFGRTSALALLIFVSGALVLGLYLLLSRAFGASHVYAIALLFMAQQLYILARMTLRILALFSQMELRRGL